MARRQQSPGIRASEEALELLATELRDGPRELHAISRAARLAQIGHLDLLAAALRLRVVARGPAATRTWALPGTIR